MGFEAQLAEVLSDRLGRDVDEMRCMLRDAFSEASRRRWAALSPEERATMQAELERARGTDEPAFSAETIAHIPLSLLPFFVRRVRDDLSTARTVWLEAYGQFTELQDSLTLWYHEEKSYRITAAELKARIDARVLGAGKRSRQFKAIVEQLERAEQNLLQELEVRLALVRSGVLADPEAVPTNMGRPRLRAV